MKDFEFDNISEIVDFLNANGYSVTAVDEPREYPAPDDDMNYDGPDMSADDWVTYFAAGGEDIF